MKHARGAHWLGRAAGMAAAMVLLGGLALSGTATAATKTYQLGAIFPLSGPNSIYGKLFSQAANLAVEDVNKSGKINGKLKVVYADSQALPQPAVVAMNKLVNVNKVKFTLTAFSGVSKAIAPIGNRQHVLMVNGGGVSPELAIGGYFLNDIPLSNDEVKALWPYAVHHMGIKKIAVVHVNDPFGNGVNSVIKSQCKKLGCDIVSDVSIDPSSTSFQSEVVKIRAAQPDAVYLASYGQQQNVLAKQLRDGGVNAQLLSYSAFGIPSTEKLDAAQGSIFTAEHVNYSANEMTKKFRADFKKKYGSAPNYYQVNYYNAVIVYADLIKYLQDHNQKFTGPNLLKALHSIASFDVVGGKVSFRKNGTVQMPIAINRLKNGKPETMTVVKP